MKAKRWMAATGLAVLAAGHAMASPGELDETFGVDGALVVDATPDRDYGGAMALQTDGKAVVVGFTASGFDKLMVSRFNLDGSLDGTFGTGGVVITAVGDNSRGVSLAIQPDGKIVVAGQEPDLAVVRYNTNGTLDSSFDGDGIAIIDAVPNAEPYGLALQADGKILVAGRTYTPFVFDGAFVLRLGTGGSLDTSFDGDGILIPPNDALTSFNAVKVQSDGKIVLPGAYFAGQSILVYRLNADGSPDTGWDADGVVATSVGAAGSASTYALSAALQADGKIVVSGGARDGNDVSSAVLARYNSDGSLDTGFGSAGIALAGGAVDFSSVEILPDGRFLFGGTSSGRSLVGRYNADGSPDDEFGGGDAIEVLPEFADLALSVGSFKLLPDGKILGVGTAVDQPFAANAMLVLTHHKVTTDCEPVPRLGCQAGTKVQMGLKTSSTPSKDSFSFAWSGPDFTVADLADPTTSADYSLCVYDADGLALFEEVEHGGTCGTKPCWSGDDKGYSFADKDETNYGISSMKFAGSVTIPKPKAAKLSIKGKGSNLYDAALPLSGTVVVQLVNEQNGACVESSFSGGQIKTNEAAGFSAKAP